MCVLDVLSMRVKAAISHWRLRPALAVIDPLVSLTPNPTSLVPGTIKQQRLLATCPRPVNEEDIARIFARSIANW